jgi:hypothetical protein
MLFTYEEFKNHYNIRLNFIEYFSILSAIPHRWKLLIRGIGKLKLIENDIVDRLKRDPKPCKYFSKQYMLNVKMLPLNIQSKWEKEVHKGIVIEDYNWSCIYCIPFSVTKDTKLQNFQYKLVHRILITNSFLYKCELKETELCTFCTETKESLVSILHYLWGCPVAKRFWTLFNIWFSSALDLEVFELTPKETVLGIFSDESSLQKIVPFLFLVARNYIHCCKWTDAKPVLNIFKIKVKQKEKIEKINALVENKMYKHDNKWCCIHELNL